MRRTVAPQGCGVWFNPANNPLSDDKVFIKRRPNLAYRDGLFIDDESHSSSKNEYIYYAGEGPLDLYEINAVLEASSDEWAILAEGEKDAETGKALGYVSTTAPDGEPSARRARP
jgi:hypothetical protein